MANITQADIEAAEEIGASMASYYEFGCSDRYQEAKMFAARHREAAIKQRDAEIVAMPAFHNLRHNRKQADMDGAFVTVSRQALDEVLDAIERGEVGE